MKKIYTYMMMMLIAAIATTSFTSCETSDEWRAETLIDGDWQGYISAYYNDRWGLTGDMYRTTLRFVSNGYGHTSGRGYEVDYNVNSPYRDYAYCRFDWMIVNGRITLIYDDDAWNPVYIYDYSLSSRYFEGYLDDGTNRSIRFSLENVNFDWEYYWDDPYYDDWGYYNYRTRGIASDSTATVEVPVVNNGKSVLSGEFAK